MSYNPFSLAPSSCPLISFLLLPIQFLPVKRELFMLALGGFRSDFVLSLTRYKKNKNVIEVNWNLMTEDMLQPVTSALEHVLPGIHDKLLSSESADFLSFFYCHSFCADPKRDQRRLFLCDCLPIISDVLLAARYGEASWDGWESGPWDVFNLFCPWSAWHGWWTASKRIINLWRGGVRLCFDK